MTQKTNVCGVISVTLSFLGLLSIPCMGAGLLMGIPAFIFGIIGLTKKDALTGSAIAGTIISIFVCITSVLFLLFFGTISAAADTLIKNL